MHAQVALLICTVGGVLSILEIDELRKMVTNSAVRNQLKRLEKDTTTPRSQIYDQALQIAGNLSTDVQNTYEKFVNSDAMKDEAKFDRRTIQLQNSGAPQSALDANVQMFAIQTNQTLSVREAKAQMKALERSLSRSDRKLVCGVGSCKFDD